MSLPMSLSTSLGGKAVTATFLCLLALMTVSASWGAGHRERPAFPIDLAKQETRASERFARLDLNANSVIELEEFLQAEPTERSARKHSARKPGRHHANGKQRRQAQADPETRQAMQQAVRDQAFKLMDEDGDGNVSAEEYANTDHQAVRREARKRAMFQRFDADGSGDLTESEMPSRIERLRAMDADGDGQVTRQEFRAARRKANA